MKPEISTQKIEVRLLLPFLEEMLAEGKEVCLTVTGNSMYPLLRDRRDSVLLVKTDAPQKYDIALFVRENGEAVLHRITRITKNGYIMLGDNQTEKEGPIMKSQIVAVVKGFCRNERMFSCQTWWYGLYCRLWTNAGPLRRIFAPLVPFFGRIVKRMERME